MNVRRRVLFVAGVLLASLVAAVSPVRAEAPAGGLAWLGFQMAGDAPAYTFPGASRGEPIEVDLFSAEPVRGGFELGVEPVVAPTSTGVTTRIAFYPAGEEPWALQWKSGATKAEVATQERAGKPGTTVDSLPQWTGNGSTRQVTVEANIVKIELSEKFLDSAGVQLPDLTAVQLQHEVQGDGTVTFQGDPVVDWGAMIGRRGPVQLPPFGIVYDAEHRAQPWVIQPTCAVCKFPPNVTLRGAPSPQGRSITISLRDWVIRDGIPIDQVRAYADADEDPATAFETFDGAICGVPTMTCDLFSGNDHDAQVTGQATLATSQDGRRVGFAIIGADFLVSPTWEQYELLFKPSPDATTSVAVRTPWMMPVSDEAEPSTPSSGGLVTPDQADALFLDPDAAQELGLVSDPAEIATTTDANQLPLDEETRAVYRDAGLLAEKMLFYTVPGVDPNTPSAAEPGTTVFGSESVDVFADAKGAQAVHRELDEQVKSSDTAKVIKHGKGDKPTILQATSGGQTTTTAYFGGGLNVIIVVRTVCHECESDEALDDFRPVLRALLQRYGEETRIE